MMKLLGSVLAMGGLTAAVFVFWLGRFDLSAAPAQNAPAKPAQQAASTPPQALAAQAGPQSVSLAADRSGHFVTDVRINGIFIKGLVDTGATIIAIPLKDARTLGINPPQSAYTMPIRTANGEVRAAKVTLGEVRIGPVVVAGVDAAVVPQGLDSTLIGMSFFRRLSSFEMRGQSLVLRQ
ncbi:MAG TPA: TIGR02281 family clan AA aspartic protease [Beijerinckiaceae bacterium]|nr:TIGR02281 family clan AA aspartic protease [Beijerinckiaceae bacterium]